MCRPIFKMPSFYSHALNGIFLLFAIVLVIINFNEIKKLLNDNACSVFLYWVWYSFINAFRIRESLWV